MWTKIELANHSCNFTGSESAFLLASSRSWCVGERGVRRGNPGRRFESPAVGRLRDPRICVICALR